MNKTAKELTQHAKNLFKQGKRPKHRMLKPKQKKGSQKTKP